MKATMVTALVALMASRALPAQAGSDFLQCGLFKRVVMTKSLAEIPSPVLAQLPGLGAADDHILSGADDPSDPINDNVPSVRLAAAFSEGRRWAVVYETGDFKNTRVVALFSITSGKASLVRQQAASQDAAVCGILKSDFPD